MKKITSNLCNYIYVTFVSYIIFLSVSSCQFKSPPKYLIEEKTDTLHVQIFNSNGNDNYTPIINSILKEIKCNKPVKVHFSQGKYHFFSQGAKSKQLSISNNDSGKKKIIFDLYNINNIQIDGGNSSFIFHGSVIPFCIHKCENVKLTQFSIQWDYPFVLEGLVVKNNKEEKWFDIKISNNNKYWVENNRLFFGGYDWRIGLGENIIYDLQTKRPIYNTSIYEHDWRKVVLNATKISDNVVRLQGSTGEIPPLNSVYIDKGPHGLNREIPAVFADDSKNLSLEKINIYESGAMAVIVQKTDGVVLNSVSVEVLPNSERMISASADATHFVNCKGLIHMKNCKFESMLDDATNIHGTYQLVDSVVNQRQLYLSPGHFQQAGFNLFNKGDTVGIVDRKTLKLIDKIRVSDYQVKKNNYFVLLLETPVAIKSVPNRYVVENLTWQSSFLLQNCSVSKNRARSVLISTPRGGLIEKCYFSSSMAAIRICGDANYWFESGNVNNVEIRENTFEEIGISGHVPQAVLQIDPIIGKDYRTGNFYHHNIVFKDNIIKTFDPLIVYALSVKGLKIINNQIVKTNNYSTIFGRLSNFDLIQCKDVFIKDNSYYGTTTPATISISNCDKLSLKIDPQRGFSQKLYNNTNPFFYNN